MTMTRRELQTQIKINESTHFIIFLRNKEGSATIVIETRNYPDKRRHCNLSIFKNKFKGVLLVCSVSVNILYFLLRVFHSK